ncbi:MarR family transcriptional regulator [Rathayibacter sp. VKM Ac-2929]|uniref:MarR family winged helix-turn-helix transcriptional regulator n=1 Tax=Rathayibacter sp. VKM Ac-2929 TaxID=2929480 RepID=UPI001FB3939A|nr:MarR family transcriptional regulator [Rathayibacter sp. VKM Ac-2929]MCJ1675537.1 MarR family transcriptional regulator [Rathayibacter sp. VKM Ac-2929]
MSSETRLANEAWEALFRAQVVLMREFAADDIWIEISQNEYDVLYTLSKAPDGLSMVEVNRDILMTQGGVSRLVNRLVERRLIDRCVDLDDRRASRLRLTDAGRELQRAVGRRHAHSVAIAMKTALNAEQMQQLRDLSTQIVTLVASRDELAETTTKQARR